MVRTFRRINFLLFVCLLISQHVKGSLAGSSEVRPQEQAAEDSTVRANGSKNSAWSDTLKNIPIGPYKLDIGGSVRLRFEHSDDFNIQRYADQRKSTLSRDEFLLYRSRANLDLRFSDQSHFYTEFQDAGACGSDFSRDDLTLGAPYWNSLDLRQAYLEWRRIGDTPLGVKLGRQRILYGDDRIWGPGEWGNVGRYAWDAVKLIADIKPAQVHFLFARRVIYDDHNWDSHDSNLDVFGSYATLKNLPVKLDLFWVGKHTDSDYIEGGNTVAFDTHTVGLYIDGEFRKAWDYRGTFANTFGDYNNDRVETYGANARIGYTFDTAWEPRVGVEYTYASGDSDPDDGVHRTFDSVFGSVAVMYGRMNLFCWMNIHDYQLSHSLKPTRKTKVSLDWHWFYLDEAKDAWYYSNGRPQRRDPTGKAGSSVGKEVDLVLSHKYGDHVQLQTGYAHFFPGSFLEATGPSPDADWFFFQTLYSF